MATESGGASYPTEDEYVEEITEERDVPLPSTDGDMAFRVQTVQPLDLLMSLKRHGMTDLLDEDARDDMDFTSLFANDQFTAFMEEIVVPNIVKPNVYLEDPSKGDFSITKLDLQDDLPALLSGLMATDDLDVDPESGGTLGDSFPE